MSHKVKSGDFIIISSDGLFDNLYEDEIAMVINNHLFPTPADQNLSSCVELNAKQQPNEQQSSYNFKTVNNAVTSDKLSSACELLVQRASKGMLFVLKLFL